MEEAGGTVTGLQGQELLYGLPEAWQRFGLLGSNGHIHAAALGAPQRHPIVTGAGRCGRMRRQGGIA